MQWLSQILCPFSTDIVHAKIESGECLYWSIMVYMQSIRIEVMLPCYCAVLEPDVVLLQHQYCSTEEWEWWVSILIDNGRYAVDQNRSCLTVLLCSAWVRCRAPSAPISFDRKSRVVSVYMKTQIKSNAFKWLKVVASHSFRNHFLLFTVEGVSRAAEPPLLLYKYKYSVFPHFEQLGTISRAFFI